MRNLLVLLLVSLPLAAEEPPPWSQTPEVLTLQQQKVHLKARLWNEHGPKLDADQKRTRAQFELQPALTGAQVRYFWAQTGKEKWASGLLLGRPDNGPYWKDQAEVKLTCKVDYQGKTFFLRGQTRIASMQKRD